MYNKFCVKFYPRNIALTPADAACDTAALPAIFPTFLAAFLKLNPAASLSFRKLFIYTLVYIIRVF